MCEFRTHKIISRAPRRFTFVAIYYAIACVPIIIKDGPEKSEARKRDAARGSWRRPLRSRATKFLPGFQKLAFLRELVKTPACSGRLSKRLLLLNCGRFARKLIHPMTCNTLQNGELT